MKRHLGFLCVLFSLIAVRGFAQFFPKVEKPTAPEMSLLVLQASKDEDGKMGKIQNMNFTGWVPAVMNAEGTVVPFRNFDAGADFTNIYYAENLPAGEYKLIGFYHIYTDYTKLEEYQKKFPSHMPSYTPYKDMPYHVKQLISLSEPIIVALEPNKIQTFGSYLIKFAWVGGMGGTTPDRWKVIEARTSIAADPKNETVLRYMKSWATPAWKKWNEKNSATQM